MDIYTSTIITSIIAFLVCLIYYKVIFKKAMLEEIHKKFEPKNNKALPKIMHWLSNYLSILIVVFAYATLGYTFRFFILAPTAIPLIVAGILWLIITSALITSASRMKQSQVLTFLHSGYWFIVLVICATILPTLIK